MKFILKILLLSIAASSLLFTQKWEKVELPNLNNRPITNFITYDNGIFVKMRNSSALYNSYDLENWEYVGSGNEKRMVYKNLNDKNARYKFNKKQKELSIIKNLKLHKDRYKFCGLYFLDTTQNNLNIEFYDTLRKESNLIDKHNYKNFKHIERYLFKEKLYLLIEKRLYIYDNLEKINELDLQNYKPGDRAYMSIEKDNIIIYNMNTKDVWVYYKTGKLRKKINIRLEFSDLLWNLKKRTKFQILNDSNLVFINNNTIKWIDLDDKNNKIHKSVIPNNTLTSDFSHDLRIKNGLLITHLNLNGDYDQNQCLNLSTFTKDTINDTLLAKKFPSKIWNYEFFNERKTDEFTIIDKDKNILKSFKFNKSSDYLLVVKNDYAILLIDEIVYKLYRNNLELKELFKFEKLQTIDYENGNFIKYNLFSDNIDSSNDTLYYEFSTDNGKNWKRKFVHAKISKKNHVGRGCFAFDNSHRIKLINDRIFSITSDTLYTCKLSEKKLKSLIDISDLDYEFYNDRLYFISSDHEKLYLVDKNGIVNNLSVGLDINVFNMDIDNGYLYVTNTSDLYRLKLEDEQVENYTDNSGLITVSPNMASDVINVTSYADASENSFEVYDVSGRRYSLEFKSFDKNNYEVDISDLPKGKYFIRIEDTEISTSFYRE